MNTNDIELPPLPDDEVADAGAFMGAAQVMTAEAAQAYARAAIEADRKRRDDLEAQLEKAVTERDDYHDMADQLAEQIAAITDQEIGEHSSGNNPWQNAMLAADEWIARDIRRLTDGVDRKRRGEPVGYLPELSVTKGGIPFEDQNEGIRQFKEACMAAADLEAKRAALSAEPMNDPSDEALLNLLADCGSVTTMNGVKAIRLALTRYGQSTQPAEPVKVPNSKNKCWCRTCRPLTTLEDMRFVVCPDCGNKRCPRANDHRNECTGSNEPGQKGSAYENCAGPVAAQAQPYSLNLDPAGIRALTADAITGALAFGYQGVNPPPASDHWLAPFWEIGRDSAVKAQQPVSGSDGLDAAVDKAWSRFQAAIAPTDDELEEFAGRYADERGCIHDDTHAEMARALLDEFATRHRYASPGDTQPQPSGNAGEFLPTGPSLPLNDPAAAYRVLHDYGRQCYKAALSVQADWHRIADERAAEIVRLDEQLAAQASGQDRESEAYQRGLRDGRQEGDSFIRGTLA